MTSANIPIKIAHSPDSDDAFMFYALKHDLIDTGPYAVTVERCDIEELNHLAKDEVYDVTAISMHAYAHLAEKYVLTASGASMAEKDWGPLLISKKPYAVSDLKNLTVAVPGEWTTAFLVLKMIEKGFKHVAMPFEKIMGAVEAGTVDAGLIIHEGQLQYEEQGFHKILCIVDYWKDWFGDKPLPLGGSAIKKSLGAEHVRALSKLQYDSIAYAMKHPAQARDYALQFKRDLSVAEADQYLSWYANERTLDMGAVGKEAVELLLARAYEKGILDHKVNVEIV